MGVVRNLNVTLQPPAVVSVEVQKYSPVKTIVLNEGPAGKSATVLYGVGSPPAATGLINGTFYFQYDLASSAIMYVLINGIWYLSSGSPVIPGTLADGGDASSTDNGLMFDGGDAYSTDDGTILDEGNAYV